MTREGEAHFSVDGTRAKALASMKSFQPKPEGAPPKPEGAPPEDEGPGDRPGHDILAKDQPEQTPTETAQMPRAPHQHRNAEVDFRGEKRSNARHTCCLRRKTRR
jgi:hypothetical protein